MSRGTKEWILGMSGVVLACFSLLALAALLLASQRVASGLRDLGLGSGALPWLAAVSRQTRWGMFAGLVLMEAGLVWLAVRSERRGLWLCAIGGTTFVIITWAGSHLARDLFLTARQVVEELAK